MSVEPLICYYVMWNNISIMGCTLNSNLSLNLKCAVCIHALFDCIAGVGASCDFSDPILFVYLVTQIKI